ncbi:MAG: hypothetical protein D6805_02660 [Planctomycetota bacterium]|nr:MAG: hypothetical protein D6805_02660 [Planctomycetota bacterium]
MFGSRFFLFTFFVFGWLGCASTASSGGRGRELRELASSFERVRLEVRGELEKLQNVVGGEEFRESLKRFQGSIGRLREVFEKVRKSSEVLFEEEAEKAQRVESPNIRRQAKENVAVERNNYNRSAKRTGHKILRIEKHLKRLEKALDKVKGDQVKETLSQIGVLLEEAGEFVEITRALSEKFSGK